MQRRVWYILMAFPLPSETFVCNDVEALGRLGVDIEVHGLRGKRSDADRLLRHHGLEELAVTWAGLGEVLRGLLAALRHPLLTLRLLAWIVRHSGGRPAHLAKALALVPRSLQLLERARRQPPDVVHLYWGHYPSVFAWLLLETMPEVVLSVGLSSYDLLRAFPGSADVARRADVVSTWAGANVPEIVELGIPADEVVVCHQGVDLRHLAEGRPEKVPGRIVTAARLVESKGVDDVLRALARLRPAWPEVHLAILGDGPDRERLERLAGELGVAEAVEFHGFVPHSEVFAQMRKAEIFLFMTRYVGERLPNVVKEAMASRCVVVSTWSPGMEELVEDGTHAHVVPQGEVDGVVERIDRVLSDREAAGRMADAAHARVHRHFDVDRLMAGMLERWEREIPEGGRPA